MSTSLPSPPLLFIAFFTSHCSPLSERLEQANRGLTLTQTHTHVKLINLIIYLVFSVTRFTLKIIRAQSFSADYLYDLHFHLSLFHEKNRTVWTLKLKVGNYIAILIKVDYQHST